jgi:O-methyltransferase
MENMFNKFREMWGESLAFARLKRELISLIPSDQLNELLSKFNTISKNVECPHNPSHILSFVVAMLKLPQGAGIIVEAGCFKGGSTAKFSLVAKYLGRSLVVFDSFAGLPPNAEDHKYSIGGTSIQGWFKEKEFCGSIEEVKRNVSKYGEISACEFVKGWFEDTLPVLSRNVCAAYLDVDLASSTRTCLKYLYPKIIPGGVLMSQDGDFPLVIKVFDDTRFWKDEIGCHKPTIEGLGKKKILTVYKPND